MFENKYYTQWWGEMEEKAKYPRRIPHRDLHRAEQAWHNYENSKQKSHRMSFIDFLRQQGKTDKAYKITCSWHCDITEEGYQIVQRCLSPHSHALLTAYWLGVYNTKK
jgi:hypothetical protein